MKQAVDKSKVELVVKPKKRAISIDSDIKMSPVAKKPTLLHRGLTLSN
jgi:hypothetical protein